MNRSLDDAAAPNPRVICKQLDGEAVLLDLDTETYFGLNETAARFWTLLAAGNAPRRALETMGEEYDAPGEVLRSDLEELLDELERLGLMRTARA